ncbi:hypothetical protein NS365_05475 [Aureimonas ureilytica]|uniref:Uncharacterized protein n=1 Tax=Aureimonas ureilytica TaxID=401562 RepID=A0A175RSV5_9HYPH|nr:hypothetical protein NS365_05475 [Aureimonas ureilytica]
MCWSPAFGKGFDDIFSFGISTLLVDQVIFIGLRVQARVDLEDGRRGRRRRGRKGFVGLGRVRRSLANKADHSGRVSLLYSLNLIDLFASRRAGWVQIVLDLHGIEIVEVVSGRDLDASVDLADHPFPDGSHTVQHVLSDVGADREEVSAFEASTRTAASDLTRIDAARQRLGGITVATGFHQTLPEPLKAGRTVSVLGTFLTRPGEVYTG